MQPGWHGFNHSEPPTATTHTTPMKTKRSLSLIITTALCALAFLFSASDAEAKVIGSIKVTGKVTRVKTEPILIQAVTKKASKVAADLTPSLVSLYCI